MWVIDRVHILHRVALCDGCEALQSRIVLQFQGFILILDFVHANEYLWDAANSLLAKKVINVWSGSKAAHAKSYLGRLSKLLQTYAGLLNTKKQKCRKEHNSTKQPTTSSATCLTWITKLICPMVIQSHRAQLKALVGILLKTALNSLACAGFKQALKIYCACALWPKMKIGTHTTLTAENNGNSVYTAKLHSICKPSKPKP